MRAPTKFLAGVLLSVCVSVPALSAEPAEEPDWGARFGEFLHELREQSVRGSQLPPDEILFDIAVESILRQIGDTHGQHLSREEYERLQADSTPQHYTGVGVKLAGSPRGALIVEIFEDSPIAFVGAKIGDHIVGAGPVGQPKVQFDRQNIRESLKSLARAIKGPVGTDVALDIRRNNSALGEIIVQRIETRAQQVFMDLTPAGILTIRIAEFSSTVGDDILTLLENRELWDRETGLSAKVKALALDVRNDPGGVLRTAVRVSDMLLKKEQPIVTVVSERGQQPFMSNDEPLFPVWIPKVVLINGKSASASEIVAGAVQGNKAGWLFGTKSYGKGSVQTIQPLAGGGAMRATTAIYLAAGTIEIDGVGLTPNLPIEQPPSVGATDDAKRINRHLIYTSMDPEIDRQLAVAHKFLLGFVHGTYSTNSMQSVLANMENAKTASVNLTRELCLEKELFRCPLPTGTQHHPLMGGAPPPIPPHSIPPNIPP